MLMLFNAIIATNFLLAPVNLPLDDIHQLEASDSKTTRIYLIRHGESAFNQPDSNGMKFTSGRSHSIELTDKGREQATNLGLKLVERLSKDAPIVILSSTAVRAQETANRLFDELKLYYSIERGDSYENLCELGQGDWEGKPKDARYDNAMKIWEDLSAKEKFTFPKISTGESYSEVAARFLTDLKEIIKCNPNKTILITTHYAAMNALALQLSGFVNELSEEHSTPLPTVSFHNCDMLLLELPAGDAIKQAKVQMHIKSEV